MSAQALSTEDFLAPSPVPEAEDAVEAYLAQPATRAEVADPTKVAERIKLIRQTEEQRADDEAAARREALKTFSAAQAVLDEAYTTVNPILLNLPLACEELDRADRALQAAWREAHSLGADVGVKPMPLNIPMHLIQNLPRPEPEES